MARLSCVVPQGGIPQGMPRVYLACHPADLTKYRKQICDDIWEHSRCAIYYCEDASAVAVDSDYYSDLAQMQLIVIPVTSRFLNEKNLARDVDFPYAMQQNIPVLPLMQQPGLEEQFNKACGQLQFLNPKDSDSTAIRYHEKLKKYLQAVLLDDSRIHAIRSAFDASIFLSYRKKDRRHAQKLIKLIHRNDDCRSVAVWYDEFLVPGENFNSNIRTAIETCDLFVLAVTPNMVNENNYVMTTEYPLARQLGKPVLAVEMVDTDAVRLAKHYPKIPVCIDAENETVLSGVLSNCFYPLSHSKRTPQKNYLLGQAYLSGIQVETDRQLGLQLITDAAEKGCEEAMEALATMYTVGNSVSVNEQEAFLWWDRLLQQAKERYARSGSLEDGIRAANRYMQIAEKWKSARRNDQAKEYCYAAAQLLIKLHGQYGKDELLKQLAACAGEISDIFEDEFAYEEAESWASQAVQIAQQYAQKTSTVGAYKLLYYYCWKRGFLLQNAAEHKAAAEVFQRCLEVLRLLEPYDLAYVQAERISVYEHLGESTRGQNPQEALAWLCKAAELEENRLGVEGEKHTLREKYINIAKLNSKIGRFRDVRHWMCKAEACAPDMTDALAEAPVAERYNYCEELAEAYQVMGFTKEAIAYYHRALEIAEKQANATSDEWYMMKAEYACRTLAKISGDHRYLEAARMWQRRETQNLHNSTKRLEFGPRERELIQQYQVNSMRCLDDGLYPEAIEWMGKAVEELERFPREGLVVEFLLDCYEQYGNTCGEAGDLPAKRFWYEKACKLYEEGTSTRVSTDALESMYLAMARLSSEEEDFAQALTWHEKRMNLLREKDRRNSTQLGRSDIARCWIDIAHCQTEKGMFRQARKSYGQALQMFDKLKQEDVTYICVNEHESVYEGLGRISAGEGNTDEAIGYYKKVILSRATRLKQDGGALWLSSRELFFPQLALKLAENLKDLGSLYVWKGNAKDARIYYGNSVALLEEAVKSYNHPQDRKKLSEVRLLLQKT